MKFTSSVPHDSIFSSFYSYIVVCIHGAFDFPDISMIQCFVLRFTQQYFKKVMVVFKAGFSISLLVTYPPPSSPQARKVDKAATSQIQSDTCLRSRAIQMRNFFCVATLDGIKGGPLKERSSPAYEQLAAMKQCGPLKGGIP